MNIISPYQPTLFRFPFICFTEFSMRLKIDGISKTKKSIKYNRLFIQSPTDNTNTFTLCFVYLFSLELFLFMIKNSPWN